jgi:hypothetical protein
MPLCGLFRCMLDPFYRKQSFEISASAHDRCGGNAKATAIAQMMFTRQKQIVEDLQRTDRPFADAQRKLEFYFQLVEYLQEYPPNRQSE